MKRSEGLSRGTWRIHMVGIATVVVVGVALHLLWLQPALQRVELLDSVLRKTETAETDLQKARRAHAALTGRLASVRNELADVRLELQPRDALNRRIADIVAVAGATGLDVSESRAGDASSGRWFDTVAIRIQGRGRFSDSLIFLQRLFGELSDVDVSGFDISRSDGDRSDRGSFRFDLAWYAAPAGSAIVDARDER